MSASERLKRKKAGIAIDKNDEGDKEAVNKVTELANSILTHSGNMDIYQETFEEISNKVSVHYSGTGFLLMCLEVHTYRNS